MLNKKHLQIPNTFFQAQRTFWYFDKLKPRDNPQKPATFEGLTGDLSTLPQTPQTPMWDFNLHKGACENF